MSLVYVVMIGVWRIFFRILRCPRDVLKLEAASVGRAINLKTIPAPRTWGCRTRVRRNHSIEDLSDSLN